MTSQHPGQVGGQLLRLAIWLAAVAVVCCLPLSVSYAQIISGDPSTVSQRFTYLSWKLDGDTTDVTVSQWLVPIIVKAGLAEDWELAVFSAASGSDANWDIENSDISGLTDSRVQISHSLAQDQVLLSGGLSLPTGVTELSNGEKQLTRWLSADFFDFPVKYPGEGLNLFGEIGVALPAGDWVWGASGAVHYAGEYTPFEGGSDYQPGTRLVGTVGAERSWPKQGKVSADILVINSFADKADGKDVFTDGLQTDIRLSGRREFASGNVELAARFILRGKNKVISESSLDLVREESNTNGNDIRFYLSGRRDLGPRAQGWASVEARFLAANGYDPGHPLFEDAARVIGASIGADLSLSDRVVAGAGLRYWTGSSDGAYTFEAIDLTGLEVLQRITVTF
jgi:hypothetical protein